MNAGRNYEKIKNRPESLREKPIEYVKKYHEKIRIKSWLKNQIFFIALHLAPYTLSLYTKHIHFIYFQLYLKSNPPVLSTRFLDVYSSFSHKYSSCRELS